MAFFELSCVHVRDAGHNVGVIKKPTGAPGDEGALALLREARENLLRWEGARLRGAVF